MLCTRLSSAKKAISSKTLRAFSTKAPVVPRIVDRRINETGPGGRASDAGLKVAVFGATGLLGRYVCCHLGAFDSPFYLFNSKSLLANEYMIWMKLISIYARRYGHV
mmetsp:Transcript_7196/g.10311  ORF Transcript_7196/g.10311 Transcript_7196/m.10311 type:complete len:107 (+) Transcript_7196:56-376(+)